MWLVVLFGSLVGGDVERLGADQFEAREAAHSRLRGCGLAAVPKLLGGIKSESPEIRQRATELLAPWRRLLWNLEAAAILGKPELAEGFEVDLFHNEKLKLHLYRLATKLGCNCYDPYADFFGFEQVPFDVMTPEELRGAVGVFRIQLGTQQQP